MTGPVMLGGVFFFFKQKTAYEIRKGDWSSDVCSSDLVTLDVVDAKTLKVFKRIPLSGRPNNVDVAKDGAHVYVGIAQAPGAVDVIDTASLTNVKSIPVKGAIHNVYVTPDGKYAVAGSIPESTINDIDTSTNTLAWTLIV